MKRIKVAVIGTGWIGAMRAKVCASSPLVEKLYLAEIDAAKGEQVAQEIGADWTTDYHKLLAQADLDAVFVSTTPEATHYPIARDCLLAGKHVLLEKPMALTLKEADELIALARDRGLKFTIGYTQRFNPTYAYVKQCLSDGTLGRPVTALVSHSDSRSIGSMIGKRGRLGPAQMVATHDLDFLLWCAEGARPKRVFAQTVSRILKDQLGVPDGIWIMVTMDDGTVFTIGAWWVLPPSKAHFAASTVEFIGTEGAIQIDDSRRDIVVRTLKDGMFFPLATRPGEQVGHVFQGPLQAETLHFLACVALDRPVLVTPEQARQVMEVTLAAELSAERGEPIDLPLA